MVDSNAEDLKKPASLDQNCLEQNSVYAESYVRMYVFYSTDKPLTLSPAN